MTRSLEEELADLIIHNNAGSVSLVVVERFVGGWSGVRVGGGGGVLEAVHSSMHVANFLFLTHGGCLPFSFNCLC